MAGLGEIVALALLVIRGKPLPWTISMLETLMRSVSALTTKIVLPQKDEGARMDIIEILAYEWGLVVVNSDGIFLGLTAWRWGEAEPFFDTPGETLSELLGLLDLELGLI